MSNPVHAKHCSIEERDALHSQLAQVTAERDEARARLEAWVREHEDCYQVAARAEEQHERAERLREALREISGWDGPAGGIAREALAQDGGADDS